MKTRGIWLASLPFAGALVACVLALGGCGGITYATAVNSAAARVEQARAMGAETQAPYEYYYAKAHLEQAEEEAAEASYQDAASFAETAEEYASKAIETTQSRRGDK